MVSVAATSSPGDLEETECGRFVKLEPSYTYYTDSYTECIVSRSIDTKNTNPLLVPECDVIFGVQLS